MPHPQSYHCSIVAPCDAMDPVWMIVDWDERLSDANYDSARLATNIKGFGRCGSGLHSSNKKLVHPFQERK
jgi:hypothetical protein